MPDKKKWLIIIVNSYTSSHQDERGLIMALVMATEAQAAGVEVTVGLQGGAAFLALPNKLRRPPTRALPPFSDLVDKFIHSGGQILVCEQSLESCLIPPEKVKEGMKVVPPSTFVKEAMTASLVWVY